PLRGAGDLRGSRPRLHQEWEARPPVRPGGAGPGQSVLDQGDAVRGRGPERVTASRGNPGPRGNPLPRGSTVLPRLGRGRRAGVEGGLPNPQPTPKEMLIMLSFLFRLIQPPLVRNRAGRLSHSVLLRRPRCRLAVEQLEERTVLSATATIAALGDSLTASYL